MKILLIVLVLGLLLGTYTYAIFTSNFGVPDMTDWSYNYPCDVGYNKYEGGFVFRNCYVLDLNWWDNK